MNGAAAHGAIIARATKASGAIVRLGAAEFFELLRRSEEPLVVFARGGLFRRKFRYLTAYKGLIFFTSSDAELVLPRKCELIVANRIWIPD